MTLSKRCPRCSAEVGTQCVSANGFSLDESHVERRPVYSGAGPNWAAVRKLEAMEPAERQELLAERGRTGQWLISGGYEGLSGPDEIPEGY